MKIPTSSRDCPPEVPSSQNVRFLRHFYPTPRKFIDRPDAQFAKPIRVDTHVEWEVEAITNHKAVATGMRYRVKWVGERQQHWLRAKQLRNCQRLLRDYQRQHQIPLSYWSDTEDSSENSDNAPEGNKCPPENTPGAAQPLPAPPPPPSENPDNN